MFGFRIAVTFAVFQQVGMDDAEMQVERKIRSQEVAAGLRFFRNSV